MHVQTQSPQIDVFEYILDTKLLAKNKTRKDKKPFNFIFYIFLLVYKNNYRFI